MARGLKTMAKIIDIKDQRYGELVAKTIVQGSKPTKWLCFCDCGNEIEIASKALRDGKKTHCGCKKKKKKKRKFNAYGATLKATQIHRKKLNLTEVVARRFHSELQDIIESDQWVQSLDNKYPAIMWHAKKLAAEYAKAKEARSFIESDTGEATMNSAYRSQDSIRQSQEEAEKERLQRLSKRLFKED